MANTEAGDLRFWPSKLCGCRPFSLTLPGPSLFRHSSVIWKTMVVMSGVGRLQGEVSDCKIHTTYLPGFNAVQTARLKSRTALIWRSVVKRQYHQYFFGLTCGWCGGHLTLLWKPDLNISLASSVLCYKPAAPQMDVPSMLLMLQLFLYFPLTITNSIVLLVISH